jgi:hypothetical protein
MGSAVMAVIARTPARLEPAPGVEPGAPVAAVPALIATPGAAANPESCPTVPTNNPFWRSPDSTSGRRAVDEAASCPVGNEPLNDAVGVSVGVAAPSADSADDGMMSAEAGKDDDDDGGESPTGGGGDSSTVAAAAVGAGGDDGAMTWATASTVNNKSAAQAAIRRP